MFAVCHQPPSGFAETAWVEDTAVALPSDAVRAALMLLRSVAHAGCVVSQEPTIAGVANTEPTPYELAVKPALYTRHDGGKSLVLSTTSFAAALSWAAVGSPGRATGPRNAAMPAAAPAAATKSTTMAMAEA